MKNPVTLIQKGTHNISLNSHNIIIVSKSIHCLCYTFTHPLSLLIISFASSLFQNIGLDKEWEIREAFLRYWKANASCTHSLLIFLILKIMNPSLRIVSNVTCIVGDTNPKKSISKMSLVNILHVVIFPPEFGTFVNMSTLSWSSKSNWMFCGHIRSILLKTSWIWIGKLFWFHVRIHCTSRTPGYSGIIRKLRRI